MPTDGQSTNLWLIFALMTVASWGVYGILLHTGVVGMSDPEHGRYKAFFWVGIAYFLIAVIAPGVLLLKDGVSWKMPPKAVMWSLAAGTAGAIGAFCVLVAFAKKGHPAVVMSIIFAGAPVVNAIVSLSLHPPGAEWAGGKKLVFFLGIALAACGGFLVTMFKPGPGKPPSAPPSVEAAESPGELR
jgi:drug/metabolite transporter (DMT)-like permease